MHKGVTKPQQDFDRGQYFKLKQNEKAFKTICKAHNLLCRRPCHPLLGDEYGSSRPSVAYHQRHYFPQRRKRWFCAIQLGRQACKFLAIKPRKYAARYRPLSSLAFVRMLISKQKPLRMAKYRKHNVPFTRVQSSNRHFRQVNLCPCTFLFPNSFFWPLPDELVDRIWRH